MDYRQQYGPWALIVGGSEGVGASWANILAAAGLNLLLVARNAERLEGIAAKLRAEHRAREIRTLALDMSKSGAAEKVIAAAADLEIGLLISNAGAVDKYGDFLDKDLSFQVDLVTLNVMNPMRLVHEFGRKMRARKRGGIMLVGSTAHLMGIPGIATYSGSKAFLAQFGEAFWHEMKDHNVHVLTYVLATTATPAVERNFPMLMAFAESADAVAQRGLDDLPNGPVSYADRGRRQRSFEGLTRAEAVQQNYETTAAFREPGAFEKKG